MCSFPASIVVEYCNRGSLDKVLRSGLADAAASAQLTWALRLRIAMDAARGLIYLHSRTPAIVHRDLKSPNILVTASWTGKLSDFNLSRVMADSAKSSTAQAMNPRWLALEILNGDRPSLASDVFAFGVCLWELMTWRVPWLNSNPWSIASAINSGRRLDIPTPDQLPGSGSGDWPDLEKYITLMRRCWAQNPGDRPAAEELGTELQQMLAPFQQESV